MRHQTSWSTAWENLKAAAGMKNFRFDDLRHTFITQGIEDNVPVEVMMAQVGHVSAEMTRYYTHLSTWDQGQCGAEDCRAQPRGLVSPRNGRRERGNRRTIPVQY